MNTVLNIITTFLDYSIPTIMVLLLINVNTQGTFSTSVVQIKAARQEQIETHFGVELILLLKARYRALFKVLVLLAMVRIGLSLLSD